MADHEAPLTDEAYWDDFWADTEVPTTLDPDDRFERVFMLVLDRHLMSRRGARLFEVGCAPGGWLAYCHQRYGVEVTGIESSPRGAAITRENLAALEVPASILEADFLHRDLPEGEFDVVLSLGFIEHFDHPGPVVARHAALLGHGGLLVLEVPHLRGMIGPLLRWTDSPLLDHHNLDVMDPRVLRAMGEQAGLEFVEGGYLGGLEPWFVDLSGRATVLRKGWSAIARVRQSWRWTDRLGGRAAAGYCYVVMRNP